MAFQTSTRSGGRLRALAVTALVLAAAGPAAQAGERGRPAACAGSDAEPRIASVRAVRSTTLCLINAERSRRGLHRLRFDRRLARLAGRHAWDMVRRDYFSHETPDGRSLRERVVRSSYARNRDRRWRVGENLAWGRSTTARPSAIVAAWMRSRSHRRLILSRRYRDIGVAVVRRAPNDGAGATYVANFGAR
ncbi:MAG: CAP domain-containing protein [Thermoleophilaceae bacterium]